MRRASDTHGDARSVRGAGVLQKAIMRFMPLRFGPMGRWCELVRKISVNLAIGLLLFAALNLKDPHLLSYRQAETPFLIACSGFLCALQFRKPRGIGRIARLCALSAIVALTLSGEYSFRHRKETVLDEDASIVRQLGEHFIVGYGRMDELRPLVSKGLVGGVFVTEINAAGKSAEVLHDEIAELQALRIKAGLPRLIVATDQEGGIVSRLSPPLEKQPSLASLANAGGAHADLLRRAEACGREQGQTLAGIGVTVNFSPVVDLQSDRGTSPLDFHSLINRRAISSSPELTADVAQAYVRGLESRGIKGTLKHFPGLGRVSADTHHFFAKLETPVAELDAHDWIPFKQVSRHTGALVMLGHVVLTDVDSENPVSFSSAAVKKIIRNSWQYDGLLVTDDLTMSAAYRHGLCNATLKALDAGVDLLLVSYDHEKFYEAMYCAGRALKEGRLDRGELRRSHDRLATLFH